MIISRRILQTRRCSSFHDTSYCQCDKSQCLANHVEIQVNWASIADAALAEDEISWDQQIVLIYISYTGAARVYLFLSSDLEHPTRAELLIVC